VDMWLRHVANVIAEDLGYAFAFLNGSTGTILDCGIVQLYQYRNGLRSSKDI
jgi:hypothetical protein